MILRDYGGLDDKGYNEFRTHSARDYQPSAPVAILLIPDPETLTFVVYYILSAGQARI